MSSKTWRSPVGKKRRTYSPQFEEAVVRAFDRGTPAADIARKKGRPAYLIRQILERRGRRPADNQRRGSRPKPKRTRDAIVAHYQKPAGILETARHFGMPYGTVWKILNKAGVLRPDGRKKLVSEQDVDERVRLWEEEGLAQATIAKRFGMGQTVVGRMLTRRGVQTEERHPKRERHGSWKGGRVQDKGKGYWWVLMPTDHPFREMANQSGYVAEHRLVVANYLGRALTRSETVHHINGNRSDNRPENLELRQGRHGTGVALQCACCGSRNIVEVPLAKPITG